MKQQPISHRSRLYSCATKSATSPTGLADGECCLPASVIVITQGTCPPLHRYVVCCGAKRSTWLQHTAVVLPRKLDLKARKLFLYRLMNVRGKLRASHAVTAVEAALWQPHRAVPHRESTYCAYEHVPCCTPITREPGRR
jgi:hypothetical protein